MFKHHSSLENPRTTATSTTNPYPCNNSKSASNTQAQAQTRHPITEPDPQPPILAPTIRQIRASTPSRGLNEASGPETSANDLKPGPKPSSDSDSLHTSKRGTKLPQGY
jgi:hypothetical protein